jgi:transcriptional antiterminator RfaH
LDKRRTNKFWIVLMTKQASSSDAIINLRNQAFEFFHPQYRRRAVRGIRQIAPLFPYYLITRIDERTQDWRVLASTRGVKGVLMDGERPGRVPDVHVETLRRLTEDTNDGYYADPTCDHPRFDPGQSVLGLRGLFAEKYGTYKGLAGNNAARVRVLFSILGREAEFEVRADDLADAA